MYDYTAGKTDWLAADLPYEGTAELAGRFVRRDVVTARETTPAGQVREQIAAQGFGPAVAVNADRIVMGAAYRDSLADAAGGTPVGQVMRFGVGTGRPSEDSAALAHRMGHADLSRIIVTRSDGTLVGLFFISGALRNGSELASAAGADRVPPCRRPAPQACLGLAPPEQ